ncbi:MAG: tyrosine-type recombinase/integrase [Sphingobacteriales bacterium]|nr:tyrosine-type recombinase/integrase [Sphingobacteriales bacterium]
MKTNEQSLQQYLQEHYSKTSIGGYENIILRYTAYMQEKAETASYTDVLQYIGYLRKLQLHPKSLRNNLFAIKIYYRYLVAIGKRKDHPCQKLYLQDQINRSIQVESLYSAVVLEELLQSYKAKNQVMQKRDEVIISLLIYQALTVLEVTQIEISQIDLEKGTIQVTGNVKNKGRTLHLKPNQIMLFYKYINGTRAEIINKTQTQSELFILSEAGKNLFPGIINRMINQDRKPHEKLLPIKIRQSVIAHYLKANNDIRLVQVFAGHRRAGSTEEYKQSGLEELKANINKLHPLQ